MSAQALVERGLEFDLIGSQAADSECVVFVYEFNRDDGCGFVRRYGFTDAVGALVSVDKRSRGR